MLVRGLEVYRVGCGTWTFLVLFMRVGARDDLRFLEVKSKSQRLQLFISYSAKQL